MLAMEAPEARHDFKIPVACKARAMGQRAAARKHGSSSANAGIAEGHSSPDSVDDGESVEPVLVGPEVELLGIIESTAQIASSAMPAALWAACDVYSPGAACLASALASGGCPLQAVPSLS